MSAETNEPAVFTEPSTENFEQPSFETNPGQALIDAEQKSIDEAANRERAARASLRLFARYAEIEHQATHQNWDQARINAARQQAESKM